jgi:hypothetical protein
MHVCRAGEKAAPRQSVATHLGRAVEAKHGAEDVSGKVDALLRRVRVAGDVPATRGRLSGDSWPGSQVMPSCAARAAPLQGSLHHLVGKLAGLNLADEHVRELELPSAARTQRGGGGGLAGPRAPSQTA